MADKTLTIKGATDKQLDELLVRMRKENELQMIIQDLKRRSTTNAPWDQEYGVSAEQPIESLYHKTDEFLSHYGVPGMKWGIRRRMKSVLRRAFGKKKKKPSIDDISEDHKENVSLKKRKINTLSNAELKKLNERMQLEKTYKELTVSQMSPGKRFVSQVLQGAAKQTAINFTSKAMTNQIEEIFKVKKHNKPFGDPS